MMWIDTDASPSSGLPEVTTEDNGKTLVVEDGAWTIKKAANPNILYIGSSAPNASDGYLLWIHTGSNEGGLKYWDGNNWVHVPVAYSV